jgi:hypothetical protein
MLGQNVVPRTVDPLVGLLPTAEVETKLELLRRAMHEYADTLPSHEEAVRNYCLAKAA